MKYEEKWDTSDMTECMKGVMNCSYFNDKLQVRQEDDDDA